jgi:hypothetical protein
MPVTRVGTAPLIAAPAHEWQTLLTVLMQAQAIKTKVVGPNSKTVVSLDLGLYQPANRLQMAREDLNYIILRPGELHIVMAQLRTIGAHIDNSGIDLCWVEAELYGSTTVKQILDGKHVKRGQTARLVTLEALFTLYQEAFSKQHPHLQHSLEEVVKKLDQACEDIDQTSKIEEAHTQVYGKLRAKRIVVVIRAALAPVSKSHVSHGHDANLSRPY